MSMAKRHFLLPEDIYQIRKWHNVPDHIPDEQIAKYLVVAQDKDYLVRFKEDRINNGSK